MKRIFVITVIVAASVIFAGCGAAPSAPVNTAANSAMAPNPNIGGVAPAIRNSNPSAVAPGANAPGIMTPGNAVNIDINAPGDPNIAMRSKKQIIDHPGPGPAGPLPARPAGDNSMISTTMTADGSFLESRVFIGDPFVSKVEKRSNGADQTVKIFLKTGRVVGVPGNMVASLQNVPLATLKTLAGIKNTTKQVSPAPNAETGKKKDH
jgi:hypothetical protein